MKNILFIVGLSVLIVFQIWSSQACIKNSKIDSWLIRAKDAGNPQQVEEFLRNYGESLEKADYVEGKYASVFKYPGTYMPTYMRAIDGLAERAHDLSRQAPTDLSYQMGLVNLEKDLGDIEQIAGDVWEANGGWIVIVVTILVWIIMFIISIYYIVTLERDDKLIIC